MHSKPSEKCGLVGRVNPQTVNSTEKFTDVVDMSQWAQVLGIALLGDMASETIDFKCYTCASDGTGAVALKNATQLAAHASNNDNKQIEINVRVEEVITASTQTKQYIKFGLVTGGATGGAACVVALGLKPRFGPATDDDLTSVVEVVA
jgi:hypothetical protein